MSDEDKLANKAQDTKGKIKEAVGGAVGNESMESEGKADQTSSDLKQAGEKVKDAFRN